MKESKNKPVQVVLKYTTGNSAAKVINANVVSGKQQEKDSNLKLDENNKLVRRYSFDDNGGGYLGL